MSRERIFKLTFPILLFCFAIMPCEVLASSHLLPMTSSFDFIMQMNGDVVLEQNDDDLYTTNNDTSKFIFGEDVFTEDNVLQHFIFGKTKAQNDSMSPDFHSTLYTNIQ